MQQQQQMMYNQHYAPYYDQYQQQQPRQIIQNSGEDNRTIWIGDLLSWMDEAYLYCCFNQVGEVVSVKIIRNRHTGQSESYGFIEFSSHSSAENTLQAYNGAMMPYAEQPFRLNWASFSAGDRRPDQTGSNGAVPLGQSENDSSNTTIFVAGLDSDITDEQLRESFVSCGEVVSVKILPGKGCGFVQFVNRNIAEDAIQRLNGTVIGKQTVCLSWGRRTGNEQWNGSHYGRQNHNVYGGSGAGTAYGVSSNADVSKESV